MNTGAEQPACGRSPSWSALGPELRTEAGRNGNACLRSADWYLDLPRTRAAARVLGLQGCLEELVVYCRLHLPNPVLPFAQFLGSKSGSRK